MGVLSTVGGIVSGLAGVGTDIYNMYNSNRNYQNQQDVQSYQKQVQQTTWDREDNAVQRRVSDLKAAGLSPTLAAGSSASSSAPISVISPSHDAVSMSGGLSNAQTALAMMSSKQNIAQSEAQTALIRQQQARAAVDTATARHDLDVYTRSGLPSNASQIGKMVNDATGLLGSAGSVVNNAGRGVFGKIRDFAAAVDKRVPALKSFDRAADKFFGGNYSGQSGQ
nr:MAG: DNA pilot protein [Microviridae sp.]